MQIQQQISNKVGNWVET